MTARARATVSEAQRAALDDDLDCLIMSSGTDAEIAADHRVSVELVRERRRIRRQDLYTTPIRARIEQLVQIVGFTGSHEQLLVRVLDGAIARAQRKAAP